MLLIEHIKFQVINNYVILYYYNDVYTLFEHTMYYLEQYKCKLFNMDFKITTWLH